MTDTDGPPSEEAFLIPVKGAANQTALLLTHLTQGKDQKRS